MPLVPWGCCFIAGLLRAGRRSGELSGLVQDPVVAVASAGSWLRSLGSFGRCQVCAARRWGGGSAVWGIFGLQGFPLGSSLKTERSATYCSLVGDTFFFQDGGRTLQTRVFFFFFFFYIPIKFYSKQTKVTRRCHEEHGNT